MKRWRRRINTQNAVISEKEKEIMELEELWNVNPSTLEWEELLSKFVFQGARTHIGLL